MVFTFLRIFILKSMAHLYNNSLIDQYEGDKVSLGAKRFDV